MKLRVLVRLKPGILDVQGAAVKRALVGLGFSELDELRIGKVVDLEVDADTDELARARVEEMCQQLLANPILEDYTIEVAEVARDLAAPRSER